jgi:hypothetical protein
MRLPHGFKADAVCRALAEDPAQFPPAMRDLDDIAPPIDTRPRRGLGWAG